MNIEDIAKICHEANKAFCESVNDYSQSHWDFAPDWQKQSAINGVEYNLANPNCSPSDTHENWLKVKLADGWKYGDVKDVERKLHPCIMPYDKLPEHQKFKDHLFKNIVKTFS